MSRPELVAKAAFRERFTEIRDGIKAGRIKFYNGPEVWTKKMLDITAFTYVLLQIREQAKWN